MAGGGCLRSSSFWGEVCSSQGQRRGPGPVPKLWLNMCLAALLLITSLPELPDFILLGLDPIFGIHNKFRFFVGQSTRLDVRHGEECVNKVAIPFHVPQLVFQGIWRIVYISLYLKWVICFGDSTVVAPTSLVTLS